MPQPPVPRTAEAILDRTAAMLAAGPDAEALRLLAAAVEEFPGNAALASRHADALQLAGRLDEAVAGYGRAIRLDENRHAAWYGLGRTRLLQRAHGDAVAALSVALRLRPDAARARHNMAEALFELGDVDAAIAEFRAVAARGTPEVRAMALASIATVIPGSPAAGNSDVLAARSEWIALAAQGVRRLPARAPGRGRPLRVGYVSAFFESRNWMKPVFGVINHHDRDRFEVHMISDGGDPSAESGYRDHDRDVVWQVSGRPNEDLAQRIAAAEIDVLVDLNGYSHKQRLGLFLHRPAPVQLGWFNMFATTGTTAFDALIGDDAVIPPDEEPFYSERILRVPGSYLAFTVAYPVPPVASAPCARSGRLTFGCLGSAYKITGDVVAAWARILRASPNATLLLKNPTLDDASDRASILRRFESEGIGAERLVLEGREEHFSFLQAYDRVDVALDTFPYNGGTTTTEALWQGVPVLAFDGDRWASRTSRSLLLAAGLDEWGTRDQSAYESTAIALAGDPASPVRLAVLRSGMRERLAKSAACDTAGLCRVLEEIYVREAAAAAGRIGAPPET